MEIKKMSSVYAHIHQYLKENKQVQKLMQSFKAEYNVDMFENVQALVNMSVNGDIAKKDLNKDTAELRDQLVNIYQNVSKEYANVINITLDHLKNFYKDEEVLRGDEHYSIGNAIAKAEKVLGRTKTKEEGLTF